MICGHDIVRHDRDMTCRKWSFLPKIDIVEVRCNSKHFTNDKVHLKIVTFLFSAWLNVFFPSIVLSRQIPTFYRSKQMFAKRCFLRTRCCIGDAWPLVRLRSQKFCTSTGITGVIFVIDDNNTGARIKLTFRNGTHIAVNMINLST